MHRGDIALMNRLALLPVLLLLVSCTDPEQEYLYRRAAAAKQPPTPLGFNLRAGTPREQVLQQLDSLRSCHALVARVRYDKDSIAHLPMEPHPLFTAGRLTGLQLTLPELDKWQWVGILDSLRSVYGTHNDRHPGDLQKWHWYWFAAGTEIDFGHRKPLNTGPWCITYGPVVPITATPGK
jgi:hypothetical protein